MTGRKWLIACASLAAGEYAASMVPELCELWPLLLMLGVLVTLFGYGLAVTGWRQCLLFLLGAMLFLLNSTREEDYYRQRPWMRGRTNLRESAMVSAGTWAPALRKDWSRRMENGLHARPDDVALNRAILLGERKRLSPRTRQLFVESGTMHIFAISGLHVVAIATVLSLLLRVGLLVPRRWAGVFSLPLLWTYVAAIGAPPSAVRAALMATFGAAAPVFWRRPDGLVAWSITFLLVHLTHPEMIVNVGSALSFAVMLSILLVGEITGWSGDDWRGQLVATVVAWAAGTPIAAHVFGRVTPGGIVANLVLLTTVKFTVYLGALGIFTSYVSDRLSAHFNAMSALCTEGMVLVAEAVSRLPGANVTVGNWPIWICGAWYLILGIVALAVWRVRCSGKWI